MTRIQFQARGALIAKDFSPNWWSLVFNCLDPYDWRVWSLILAGIIVQVWLEYWNIKSIQFQMLFWTVIGRSEIESGVRPPSRNGKFVSLCVVQLVHYYLNCSFRGRLWTICSMLATIPSSSIQVLLLLFLFDRTNSLKVSQKFLNQIRSALCLTK